MTFKLPFRIIENDMRIEILQEEIARLESENKKQEHEIEKLKGFPFERVENIKVGEIVSNADSVYICIDAKPMRTENFFFDFNSKQITKFKIEEKLRRRKDLEAEFNKMFEVKDE